MPYISSVSILKSWRSPRRKHPFKLPSAPVIGFLLLWVWPVSSAAQDISMTIPERTLNRYASAVGSTSGFGSYSYSIGLPALRINPRSTSLQEALKRLCAETRWSWNVSGPRFEITPDGIRFFAALSARMGASTFNRLIEIPVTVTFNTNTSAIEFKLSEASFPIFLSAAGGTSQVGTVNVSSAYSTTLFIPSSFPFTSDRTGRLQDINIRFSDGSIEISSQLVVQ